MPGPASALGTQAIKHNGHLTAANYGAFVDASAHRMGGDQGSCGLQSHAKRVPETSRLDLSGTRQTSSRLRR